MSTLHSQWQKKQSIIWLVCGVICLFFAGIYLLLAESKITQASNKQVEPDVEVQIQPEKVAASINLGGLVDEVKPLANTTRIKIAGAHEAEFRGTKFLNENKKDYTIELFRSSKESVIKNFLRKQEARNQFIYIRLSGEGVPEQFVLLYGNFKNRAEAEDVLSQNRIDLPSSIKPKIQSFSAYTDQVNDLGSEEVGISNVLYAVKLSPAMIPRMEVATPSAENTNATAVTTTTVTRKDQDGNVLDVQKSQSTTQTAPTSNNNAVSP